MRGWNRHAFLVRSYGHYANAARAKREREAAANLDATARAASAASERDLPEQKAARGGWDLRTNRRV